MYHSFAGNLPRLVQISCQVKFDPGRLINIFSASSPYPVSCHGSHHFSSVLISEAKWLSLLQLLIVSLTLLWLRAITGTTRNHFDFESTKVSCSRRLVDQKGNFALFEGEVDESVSLVDGVASKALPEEDVPVGLPCLVHVLLHNIGNLEQENDVREK